MAKARILVADDSAVELKVIVGLLRDNGYDVVTAADGDEAVSRAQSDKPALAVLDVVMPKKNGYQVCRALKTGADTSGIKVVMLTSKGQESDKFWGMKQGADAYLTKPVVPADLLAEIGRLI